MQHGTMVFQVRRTFGLWHAIIALFFLGGMTAGCANFIAAFDQYAYAQTTSLKVDALNVMSLAAEDYSKYEERVKNLQTGLQKMYEYEKNRPKDEITAKMWELMIDPNGRLLGSFLKRWETEKKLNPIFIEEAKKVIASNFDKISGLESRKIKPSDIGK